jgi:hypothetical protein
MVGTICICNGIIRSGSTWSFNVCRMLGERFAHRTCQAFGGAYLTAEGLDEYLQNDVYVRSGIAVIKAHAVGPVAADWIRTGKAKAVCTLRDPRDCVASDIQFTDKGFDHSVQRVVASLRSLATLRDFGRTLFIRYEDMMTDRLWQIKRIGAHLQIAIDAGEAEAIDEKTNIYASRKICQGLSSRTDDQTDVVLENHRRDLVTLLHDNHIGTGKVGRWKQDLTVEQGRMLTKIFAKSLVVLGDEFDRSLVGADPSIAAPDANATYPGVGTPS